MTTAAARTRVRADADGAGLTAQCLDCGVALALLPAADVAAALAGFDAVHPARPHAGRGRAVIAGWRAPTPVEDLRPR